MWLQKTQLIPLHIREPLFRCFHTYKQFLRLKWQGITREDIARGYVGMVVNSNFQPNRGEDGPLEYETEDYPRIMVGEPSAKVCANFLCKKTIRAIVRSLRKIKWFITKIPRIPHKLKKIIFR